MTIAGRHNIEVLRSFEGIVTYSDNGEQADFIQLNIPTDAEPTISHHFIQPFYQSEVNQPVHEYKCVCRRVFKVGEGQEIPSLEALESRPCPSCGYQGKFAFSSDVKLV